MSMYKALLLNIDLCPKGGALAHFQNQEDSKKHTNVLKLATKKCCKVGAIARIYC